MIQDGSKVGLHKVYISVNEKHKKIKFIDFWMESGETLLPYKLLPNYTEEHGSRKVKGQNAESVSLCK